MTIDTGLDTAPLSETLITKLNECTETEAIEDLRRLVEEDPERVISRNFYRVNGKYSESAWNRYFGTFLEFKRRAGVILTRHQHGMEKNVAKHASVDHYKQMNTEKMGYEEKYIRDSSGRWKTILVVSDIHDKECDPFSLRVLIHTAFRVQPDIIVLAGDIFDLPEFGKYAVDPREWDVVGRIRFVHDHILSPLRRACPNTQIDMIEGNHEFRLLRHMADATPALRAVLSDLHGMSVASLLGLDKFEINYIAKADLGAYTVGDLNKEIGRNYKIYYDSFLAHHFPQGKKLGLPGSNGHHHRLKVESLNNATFGSYTWTQLGSLHIRDATYCDGEGWNNSFMLVNVDTKTTVSTNDIIMIGDTFAVSGGHFYYKSEVESRKK